MLLKNNALAAIEGMIEQVESSINAMDKKTLNPANHYKTLNQLKGELERLEAMIKREPNR